MRPPHVRCLELSGFMGHSETTVRLPESGVVLVTGENGAGKSAIVEAAAWALWGRTLRGTPPWEKEAGEAAATAELAGGLTVERWRLGDRGGLAWTEGGRELGTRAGTHATATKAQEALDALLPSWDVWRRTHAFSSRDSANFTEASDGERKRLLESVLGLDKFDAALDACRAELREAAGALAAAGQEVKSQEAALAAAERRCHEHQQTLADLPGLEDPAPLEARAARLQELANAAAAELRAARRGARDGGVEEGRLRAELDAARRRARALGDGGCPTCGQQVPEDMRAGLRAEVEAAEARLREAGEAAAARQAAERVGEDELEEEARALGAKAAAALAAARAARAGAAQADRLAGLVRAAQAEQEEASVALGRARASLEAAAASGGELRACDAALGLRGVRAQVLAGALGGVEAACNAWLARLAGGGISARLRPYVERARGGQAEAIGLELDGAGGGHGYRATSGGQRRRVDVALMLALAEVSSAASGGAPGTMFFDEVFDALDAAGAEAAAGAIRELAASRAVVVITHSADVVRRLQPELRLRVDRGRAVVE